VTVFTTPTATSRYFTWVLSGSRPAAESKVILIVGPCLAYVVYASQAAMAAARTGISHTSGMPWRRSMATSGTLADGTWMLGLSVTGGSCGVPQQTRIEGRGGKHGKHHDSGKRDRSNARFDRRDRSQTYQSDENGKHEDVDHRPSADCFDDAIEQ